MKLLLTVLFFTFTYSQALLDGKIFDSGISMQKASANAPAEISKLSNMIGYWDIVYKIYDKDKVKSEALGTAYLHYMNRGHHIMERAHIPNFDKKNELNLISFIAYSKNLKRFNIGEGNSFTESIAIFDGDFKNNTLELMSSIRKNGSVLNTLVKRTISIQKNKLIAKELESTDYGKSWKQSKEIEYTRRKTKSALFDHQTTYGNYNSGQINEQREFDFLLGEFNSIQELLLPNGKKAKFPSNATAVHILNGNGILEYNWYDVDKNNPDAATTILRLYNRSMRRWESLYITNRLGNNLYFGGKKEGENIVLTFFNTNSASPSISFFVFHSISKNEYRWYSETTRDRYHSNIKNWTIDFKRK